MGIQHPRIVWICLDMFLTFFNMSTRGQTGNSPYISICVSIQFSVQLCYIYNPII